MVPDDLHDFFLGSAGVAGALVGLLFVAISVSAERLAKTEVSGQLHRIRAYGALTSFTNALAISLFAMIPGDQVGMTALVVGIIGLLFVAAALLSLLRLEGLRLATARDALFPAGLAVVFVLQVIDGARLIGQPGDSDAVQTIAILVAVCFLIGIARSWELIGGPSIGITREVAALVRGPETAGDGTGTAAGGAEQPGELALPGGPAVALGDELRKISFR